MDLGNFTSGLTAKGRALLDMDLNCRNYNYEKSNASFRDVGTFPPKHPKDERDDQEEEFCIRSMFTGNVAAPFKMPWMELDDTNNNALDFVQQPPPQ